MTTAPSAAIQAATPFDPAALAALYAPHAPSPDMAGLVQQLGSLHELVLKALRGVESKTKTLRAFHDPFEHFGIDMAREFPQAREASHRLAQEDHDIQSMGATSVAKCVGALDLMMRSNGVEPAVCQDLTHRAFDICAASLPVRARQPWLDYFETVGLALATSGRDGSLPPRSGPPRI